MRIALLVYEGMDLMDFAGPYEALHTADRLRARRDLPPLFEIVTVAAGPRTVTCYGGARITATSGVDAMPDCDVLVVPGTIDVTAALADAALLAAVVTLAGKARLVTSVCTGAFLLGAAGLLAGRTWTTHWEDIAALSQSLPGGVRARVADSGEVITAGGVVSGIDLGLHLIARLVDPAWARLVARQMDYSWDHYGADDGGTDPVVVEREMAAPPATVYRLWSTAAGVTEFLGVPAEIDTRVGGRYEFLFLSDAPEGERGGEGCRILALEPDRLIVFTWNSPPGMVTRGSHTWVVVSLAPTETGTRVRLAHWGHGTGPEWDENRAYFASAWRRVLDAMQQHLEN